MRQPSSVQLLDLSKRFRGVYSILEARGRDHGGTLHAGGRHGLLVTCLTMCLIPMLANAAQTDAQAPSDLQAYCVNRSGDFYPYTGEPCKSGYQLGSGNCRKADGRMVAVPREQCLAMAGTVELPVEDPAIPPPKYMK